MLTTPQTSLDITPSPFGSRPVAHRSNTATSAVSPPAAGQSAAEASAHAEQVRLLILGMEQRLQTREEKLQRSVERAEAEGQRFEQIRREVLAAPAGA